MAKNSTLPDVIPEKFEELCRLHWPRPIHDLVEYENTAEVIDRLALMPRRTHDQEDYLEALSLLVEKFDRDAFDEVASSGDTIEMLKLLMESHDMSASDLGRLLGNNRTLGPAILRGERNISRANAQILGEHFKVSPGLFFQA